MKSIAIALMLLAVPAKPEPTPDQRAGLLRKQVNETVTKLGADFKCFTLIDKQVATAIFTCDAGTTDKPERYAVVYVWVDGEWAMVDKVFGDL